jgi:nucleotide-binding universal stress UspA family protein
MTPDPRPILACVASLQSPDEPTLVAAMRVAERLGAPLHLVHVLPQRPAHGVPEGPAAAELLRMMVRRLAFDAAEVEVRVLRGPAERRLLEAAEAADPALMVLGATRRGRLARAVLGTTASHVLRATRVPILVVGERLPERRLRVLLTTDLSCHAVHAHSLGGALAASLAGPDAPQMRSLYVDSTRISDDPLTPPRILGEAERELADFLAAETPLTPTLARVRAGDPAEEIVREAVEWGADLLVLGTHARAGVPRILLGSVAETVLRNAPCAVLVVPPVRPSPVAADGHRDRARLEADPEGRAPAGGGVIPAGPAAP